MLKKLHDLTLVRSTTDSIFFFIGMTVILLGLTSLIGSVLTTVGVGGGVVSGIFGIGLSKIIGTLFVLGLGGSILSHKKLTGDLLSVIVTVLAVYLTYTTSVFLGLLLVSYLTTVKHGK